MWLHQCRATQRFDKEEAARWKYEATSRCDKSHDTHRWGCEGFRIEVSGWHCHVSYMSTATCGCLYLHAVLAMGKYRENETKETTNDDMCMYLVHIWAELNLIFAFSSLMRSCNFQTEGRERKVNVIANQFEFVTQILHFFSVPVKMMKNLNRLANTKKRKEEEEVNCVVMRSSFFSSVWGSLHLFIFSPTFDFYLEGTKMIFLHKKKICGNVSQ